MKGLSVGKIIIAACLALWGISLLTLVSPSFSGNTTLAHIFTPLLFLFIPIATIASIIVIARGDTMAKIKSEKYAYGSLARVLSVLIGIALVVTIYCAIKSLWFGPLDDLWGHRFIYENTATAVGFIAIVLTFVLSTLQNDIYWVPTRKLNNLDERQLQQRRAVFELSYKIGVGMVLGAVWFLSGTLHNIPAIVAKNFGFMPGHIYWLPVSLLIALFATPLVVASWRK